MFEYNTDEYIGSYTVEERIDYAIKMKEKYYCCDEKMIIIGITGTKGKTTTMYMLKKMFEDANLSCGIIGTNEISYNNVHIESKNTTPPPELLYKYLYDMYNAGVKYVIIEVSSQAMKYRRVYGITFDYAIYTNISNDHIGLLEHKDMEEYIYYKSQLFKQAKHSIINYDDEYATNIECAAFGKRTFYSVINTDMRKPKLSGKMVYAYNYKININDNGMLECKAMVDCSYIHNEKTEFTAKISMPGKISVYNALPAIIIAMYEGISVDIIKQSLENIKVDGRLQSVPTNQDFSVIIDYAHNKSSMEALILDIKEYVTGRIVTLFGCGGNRSKVRRYEMGAIAALYSDYIVLTSDNSRDEETKDIIDDIVKGINSIKNNGLKVQYEVILDRKEAIRYVLCNKQPKDCILILGKGHEQYQIIGTDIHPFNEKHIIEETLLQLRKEENNGNNN